MILRTMWTGPLINLRYCIRLCRRGGYFSYCMSLATTALITFFNFLSNLIYPCVFIYFCLQLSIDNDVENVRADSL